MRLLTCLMMIVGVSVAAIGAEPANTPKPFRLAGQWIEGCTCGVPCGCAMTGKFESGCQAIMVMSIRSGRYGKVDLAGAKMVVGVQPGDWAVVYLDPQTTPAQRDALLAIMAPDFSVMKVKLEAVRTAPIAISGVDGRFTVTIPDTITLQTEPVMGLDSTRPIQYHNFPVPWLRDGYQGRTVAGSYKDGHHEFTLQSTNSFWSNMRVKH
jgi:hypothetical protein